MDFGKLIGWIVNNQQTITTIAGILGIAIARFYPALPLQAKKYLDKLGGEQNIIDILLKAAAFTTYNDAEKRKFAVDEIKKIAKRNGFEIPDSIINLLVEWILGRLKIKGKI